MALKTGQVQGIPEEWHWGALKVLDRGELGTDRVGAAVARGSDILAGLGVPPRLQRLPSRGRSDR